MTERRKWSGVKYQPPTSRFEGESIQHSDYISHPDAVKEAMCTKNVSRNTNVLNANNVRFDGETNYHIDYTEKTATVCPASLLNTCSDMIFDREVIFDDFQIFPIS